VIRDNQQSLNRLRAVLDLGTVVIAYFMTYLLFFFVFRNNPSLGGSFSIVGPMDYQMAIFYIAPLHILIYALFHLYRNLRVTGRRLEAFKVFEANLISVFLIAIFFWLFVKPYSTHFSRKFLFEFGFLNTFMIVLQRNIVRIIVVRLRRKGFNEKRILLVGYSRTAEAFLERCRVNKAWGYRVEGILDDSMPEGSLYKEYRVIGSLGKLSEILSSNTVDEVFVTLRLKEYEKLESVVHICEKAGIQTKFMPDYGNLMSSKPYTEDLQGIPVIYLRQVPLNDLFNAFLKRAVDVLGSLALIVLFSPVVLVTALLIKLGSKGPVIYRQERVGFHNRTFMMYKFRSMVVQTEEAEKKQWTTQNDPRVTKVGRIIRKTSIDELPQFFNVLMGQMSLVGPRPERPQFVEKFKEEIPRYMVKHQVRPGITGWAQVNGFRGDTSITERINYDIYYIENWSLGFDIKILFLTIFKGFVNKNAY